MARPQRVLSATATRVFRTYFINSRGDEAMGTVWSYLDVTPLGRQEIWEDSPEGYPQTPPYNWWNWHDNYDAGAAPDKKWVEVSDAGEAAFRDAETRSMSEPPTRRRSSRDGEGAAAHAAARWLGLAAAPTFAIMALLTAVFRRGPGGYALLGRTCLPLSGMVPMYLLMSAFHSAAWLKLISGSKNRTSGFRRNIGHRASAPSRRGRIRRTLQPRRGATRPRSR